MAIDSKTIRSLIGENELDKAIEALLDLLEQRRADELLDQAILQKSRWKEYKRKEIGGYSDEKEINSIRDALLKLTREADRAAAEPAENRGIEYGDRPVRQESGAPSPTPPPRPPEANYTAQCIFNGDPNQYFITRTNQIVMVNPLTNYTMVVATKIPSMNPAFAWVYQFPNGAYYSVDHSGVIWGMNAFGMPMQMGYVQNV